MPSPSSASTTERPALEDPAVRESPSVWPFLVVFVSIAATLGVGAAHTIRYHHRQASRAAERELQAIAELKTQQIVRWRTERRADAELLARARFLGDLVRDHLARPGDRARRAALASFLASALRHGQYARILLLDPAGRIALSVPAGAHDLRCRELSAVAERVRRLGTIQEHDLHRTADDPPHLSLGVPIASSDASAPSTSPGTLVLVMEARSFLFPIVARWPTASPSAETLLVRREGDQVLFLNDLRHRPASALRLRRPLSTRHLPAAMVVRGDRSVGRGLDYRGVAVLAVARAVPGSAWFIVAKVDQAEAFAPVRRLAWWIGGAFAAVVLLGGLALFMLWRRRELAALRRVSRDADELRRSLAERTALLQEVHHRVKNNLQVVESLLSLQAARTADPFARAALDTTRGRVRSMALLHEKLYRASSFAELDLAEYLGAVGDEVHRSQLTQGARVTFERSLVPITLPLERAVPLGLIVHELLTNALKHAFPAGRAGRVALELRRDDGDRLVVCVTDDGVGLPPEREPGGPASLGWQLVTRLSGQLGGAVTADRPAAGGTRVTVVVPLPPHGARGEEACARSRS